MYEPQLTTNNVDGCYKVINAKHAVHNLTYFILKQNKYREKGVVY
jgi:hypothetical protein